MAGYVAFSNKADFDAWHASVNAAMGYPQGDTVQYTDGLKHPSDSRVIAGFDDRLPPDLLDGQTIKTYEWAVGQGWFAYD